VTFTDTKRFEIHRVLHNQMGAEVADAVIEAMPPFDWSQVATKKDIEILDLKMDVLRAELRLEISESKLEMKQGFADFKLEIHHDFSEFKEEMHHDFAEFTTEMRQEFAEFKTEMRQEFAEFKTEMRREFSAFTAAVFDRLDSRRSQTVTVLASILSALAVTGLTRLLW